MFTELRAKRLAKPSLLLHRLGVPINHLAAELGPRTCREEASDWMGCTDLVFQTEEYKLIASVEAGVVVAYVHDTEIYRAKPAQRLRKLTDFLEFYGSESELEFVADNGFGYLFRSQDNALRAAYSYTADIFSVSYDRLERSGTDAAQG